MANLVSGEAQSWFQWECDVGRGPNRWVELDQALLKRFGNDTKLEHAKSTLLSIQLGKHETFYYYALCSKIVPEKMLHYEEPWVRNLFILGLQLHLVT